MFVDSHCHLDLLLARGERLEDLLERAKREKVGACLTVCTESHEWPVIEKIADAEGVLCSVGIHPCSASSDPIAQDLKALRAWLMEKEKVVAIGETGLDFYRGADDAKTQEAVFRVQCEAALERGLPVIVHTRAAGNDTLRILRSYPGLFGVAHCFTETQDFADRLLDMDFLIGVSGIVTFKKSLDLQSVVKNTPLERLMLETDAPFLAPEPFRGRTNAPSFIPYVAEKVALLKDVSLQTVAETTTHTFWNRFLRVQTLS